MSNSIPFQITGPGKYRLRDETVVSLEENTDGSNYSWKEVDSDRSWNVYGEYTICRCSQDVVARVEEEAKPEALTMPSNGDECRLSKLQSMAQPALLTERERMRWEAMCAVYQAVMTPWSGRVYEGAGRPERVEFAAKEADALLAEFDKGGRK